MYKFYRIIIYRTSSKRNTRVPDFSGKKKNPNEMNKMPNEEEVVEMVNKWRLNDNTPDDPSKKVNESEALKKDNVAPEEVVEIIKIHRTELHEKAKSCARLNEKASPVAVATKMKEWAKIYHDTGNDMEWEAINLVAIEETQEEQNLEGQEEVNL